MPFPVISAGQLGVDRAYTEVFSDEFDVDGPGPGQYWMYDPLTDGLNRAGNEGQDADGNVINGSVPGKRWAAWTNGNNDALVYRQGGKLYIGGAVEQASDPTRENYTHNGVAYNWADYRFYAPYMVQWHRVWDNSAGTYITDPASPNIYMTPGHFIEAKLSLEQMRTPGFRISLWLMPIIPNEGKAYDSDAANGVEIDIFEIERWINGGYGNERVQSKILAGAAGNTTDQNGGNVDMSGVDMNVGYHTIGVLWLTTGVHWFFDGVKIVSDTDHVPQVEQFMSLTREINAGVNPANEALVTDIPSNGIKRPVDVGIYNVSAFPHKDGIAQDKAIFDYIRVWSVDGEGGTFTGPNNTAGQTGNPIDGAAPAPDPTPTPTPAVTLNPRLVIMTQPAIREGRPMQQLMAVPRDGYDPTGKTFTWTSSIPELTFSPQGSLVTTPSLSGLTAGQLATITIDDGQE